MNTPPRLLLATLSFLLLGSSSFAAPTGLPVKLETSKEKNFGASPIIIVPTVYLKLAASGRISVAQQGSALSAIGGGNTNSVRATAHYTVKGLDRQLAQELATRVYEDFVAGLRAAGYTVKTYADIKDLAPVQNAARLEKDATLGLPMEKDAYGQHVYFIATPSDEQAFKPGLGGAVFKPFMSLGKSTLGEGTVLIPTYEIVSPQVWGEKGGGYKTISAGVNASPGMSLQAALLPLLTQKGAWGDARLKAALVDVSEKVGELTKRDTTDKAGNALSASLSLLSGPGKISSNSTSFTFVIDRAAYTDGVLAGTGAFNAEVTKVIAAARK